MYGSTRLFVRRPRASKAKFALEELEPRQLLDAAAAAAGLARLADAMDEYHEAFIVYDDIGDAGNHFHGYAKLVEGSEDAVAMSGEWSVNSYEGATSIRASYDANAALWGGFVLQNGVISPSTEFPTNTILPEPNWGTIDDAGLDLSGVRRFSFVARGERGGETVQFYIGGVGWDPINDSRTADYPDSANRLPSHPQLIGGECTDAALDGDAPTEVTTCVTLTDDWHEYVIVIPDSRNMSYVLGGFSWVAERAENPTGAVFFLDRLRYEYDPSDPASAAALADRLNEPRLVRSFRTLDRQPSHPIPADDFDFKLRNIAFTYDNALVILAFLSDQSETRPDSVRRASLIGDALISALRHDRRFDEPMDWRLRSAFAAGDYRLPSGWEPNGVVGAPPTPGWYDEDVEKFFEIEQRKFDVGNNAWGMIAMLSLYQELGNGEYLDAARTLGNFITRFRYNPTGPEERGGFLGGEEWPEESIRETDPLNPRPWASTEHNIDVYAAFMRMYEITGEMQWLDGAEHARVFVESMWDEARGCYLTGTTSPTNDNRDVLPLDPQTWSALSLPLSNVRKQQVLTCIETYFSTTDSGYVGVDFNSDELDDGIWFEGLGQYGAAVAHTMPFNSVSVDSIRSELARAATGQDDDGVTGLVAATRDRLTTGFDFTYSRRLHIAAEAWNVFAQVGFNPFYQSFILGDVSKDGVPNGTDIDLLAQAIREGATDATKDLNQDSLIDSSDRYFLVKAILGTHLGDANLDGIVDSSDFDIWRANHFQPSALWASGDFNGDGRVDGLDFNLWNENKFKGNVRSAPATRNTPRAPLAAIAALPSHAVLKEATPMKTQMTHRVSDVTCRVDDISLGGEASTYHASLREPYVALYGERRTMKPHPIIDEAIRQLVAGDHWNSSATKLVNEVRFQPLLLTAFAR